MIHQTFIGGLCLIHGMKITNKMIQLIIQINMDDFCSYRLNMNDISLANLPKESRLVITLSGRTMATPENQNSTTTEKDKATEARESQERRDEYDSNSSFIQIENEELGWSSIQLFDFDGYEKFLVYLEKTDCTFLLILFFII